MTEKKEDVKVDNVNVEELKAKIELLELQNKSLKNLLRQVEELFGRQEELSNAIRGNLAIGKDILVGIAFKELNDMIVSNKKILSELVKEWKE